MTHVHIKRDDDGAFGLIVDGVDLTSAVLHGSLRIEHDDKPLWPPVVTVKLLADNLEVLEGDRKEGASEPGLADLLAQQKKMLQRLEGTVRSLKKRTASAVRNERGEVR